MTTERTYPRRRDETAEALIGKHRWDGILAALEDYYGESYTIQVGESTDRSDPKVWVNGHQWKGGLTALEAWAKERFAR